MLVLTRKQRQQITVGDNITITVLKVKGQAVRIGIEAPDGVRILRAELNTADELTEGEEPAIESSMKRAAENARRSRLGSPTETNAESKLSNPCSQHDAIPVGFPFERAKMRQEPVSLLNFR